MLSDDDREAARLRYELARLRDRRTVRAALAVTTVRRQGVGMAWRSLRGDLPRWDVPGPDTVPRRSDYPHVWVVSTGPGALVAGAVAHERLLPATAASVVTRDRPDVLLVDGLGGFDRAGLAAIATATRAHGGAVVTVGDRMRTVVPDTDLHLTTPGDGPPASDGSHAGRGSPAAIELLAAVDTRTWSPVGLDDTVPAHRRDGIAGMTPDDARRQPVVALADVGAAELTHCLAVMSAGAVVVAVDDPMWRSALDGLDTATCELLTSPAATSLTDRVDRLLADDDLRRRVSVRLRRHVQRHHSTRAAVVRVVTALGIDAAPSRRVSALLATRRPQRLPQVCEDLAAQRDVDLELIVVPHGEVALPDGLPGVSTVVPVGSDRPFGAALNAGLDAATGTTIAKVDDDDRYGPDHLGDLLLALEVSGASLVGRRIHGVFREDTGVTVHPPPGGEERFEDHLPGGTLLLPADVMREVRWRHVARAVDTELVRAVHLAGGSAYTSHRYGYVRVRLDDRGGDHAHLYSDLDVPVGTVRSGFDHTLLEA